jgi:hypothetical protein
MINTRKPFIEFDGTYWVVWGEKTRQGIPPSDEIICAELAFYTKLRDAVQWANEQMEHNPLFPYLD